MTGTAARATRVAHKNPCDLVEATLERIGAGIGMRTGELAIQTGLTELQVIDALSDLEATGHATPCTWTLGPETR